MMLFVDRLTSYAMGVPMKNLDVKITSGALEQFLSFLPAPQILMVDEDGSFKSAFEETCNANNIFLRTKLPKSSLWELQKLV